MNARNALHLALLTLILAGLLTACGPTPTPGPSPASRGGVCGLVHPTALVFDFAQDAAGLALEGGDVHGGVVVGGDEGGGGGEVNQDGFAGA